VSHPTQCHAFLVKMANDAQYSKPMRHNHLYVEDGCKHHPSNGKLVQSLATLLTHHNLETIRYHPRLNQK
jgi:hypothetical protein